jgi:hypothetical protein
LGPVTAFSTKHLLPVTQRGVARAMEPALIASEGRMPKANVRRFGTGNPEPQRR